MSNTIVSCAQERQRQRSLQQRLENQLSEEFRRNKSTLIVLNLPHLLAVWIEHKRQSGLQNAQISEAFSQLDSGNTALPELIIDSTGYSLGQDHAGTVIGAAVEGRALSTIAQDFSRSGNMLGNYRVTQGNGRYYVAFKGNHRLRTLVKGTRYLANNPLVIQLGIAAPAEMLKGAVRSNAYITLIISGGTNGIKWIFLEEYLWTNFLSDISIDLLKGGLAILAGVAATYFTAQRLSSVILARGFGIIAGIISGGGLSTISNDSIADGIINMSQEIALTYITIYELVNNPLGHITETGEKAKDVLICSTISAGGWAANKIESIIRDNINRKLDQLFNPPRRLY